MSIKTLLARNTTNKSETICFCFQKQCQRKKLLVLKFNTNSECLTVKPMVCSSKSIYTQKHTNSPMREFNP